MKRINLRGTWQAEIEERGLRFDFSQPGDLASALLAAGHIPHPYIGRNELDIQWIGKIDWRLWRVFSLSADELRPGWLEIEGLDTVAEIYLNERLIGSSRNMFTVLRLKLGDELKEGENLLEIRFFSLREAALREAEKLPYPIPCSSFADWAAPHRNLLRKVQCHSGWDWGPVLMTSGVYGNITLHLGRDRIEYLSCSQRPMDNGSWELGIKTEYYAESAGSVVLNYRLSAPDSPEGSAGSRREIRPENNPEIRPEARPESNAAGDRNLSESKEFLLHPGINILEHALHIDAPRLWWPRGYGSPELYELEVRSRENGETVRKRIGFRTIEVISEDDDKGRSMFFRVNGREIYAKGANWIPVDALPSAQTDEVYRQLLTDAALANMNMIRLWGGGQYEKDVFL